MNILNRNQCKCDFPTNCKLFSLEIESASKLLGICLKCQMELGIDSNDKIIQVDNKMISFDQTSSLEFNFTNFLNLGSRYSSPLLVDANRLYSLELNLKYIKILEEGSQQLFSGLTQFKQLTILKLYLQGNYIRREGVACLSTCLTQLTNLEELALNLKCNDIHSEGVICLSLSLINLECLSILSLQLQDNNVEQIGVESLSFAISQLTLLSSIDIDLKDNIIQTGAKYIIFKLKELNMLRTLSLNFSFCGLHQDEISVLSSVITQKRLLQSLSLNISSNQVGKGIMPLFKSISQLTQMNYLKLNMKNRFFQSKEIISLSVAIAQLKQLTTFSLNLQCNIQELQYLCLSMAQLKNLTTLSIYFGYYGGLGVQFIVKALGHLKLLESLTLDITINNQVQFLLYQCKREEEKQSQNSLIKYLSNQQSLKFLSLNLEWNNFEDSEFSYLIQYLKNANNLKELRLDLESDTFQNKSSDKKQILSNILHQSNKRTLLNYRRDYIFNNYDDYDNEESQPFNIYSDLSPYSSSHFADCIKLDENEEEAESIVTERRKINSEEGSDELDIKNSKDSAKSD